MFNKLKSKLRSNSRILKFSKRYLIKFFSVNALDPRILQSWDVDWDLSLIEFLKAIDRIQPNTPISFLRALSQGSSEFIESKPEKLSSLEVVTSLLWLISHYISAPASSHGLGLAYIGREIGADFTEQLNLVVGNMPTSIKLTTFSFDGDSMSIHTHQCGGAQSPFESQDLRLFSHKHNSDRHCAFVVDATNLDENFTNAIETTLNSQRLIAYLFLLVKKKSRSWVPAVSKNWDVQYIQEAQGNEDIYLYTNIRWKQDLISINDLRFQEHENQYLLDGKKQSQKILPLAPLKDFGGCSQVSQESLEFIAGAPITLYVLNNNAQTQIIESRAPSFFTSSPVLYEAINVCVSGASVVWRDHLALGDVDLSHDFNRSINNSIIVDKPTCNLEGEYFLVPTNNPHHSHLMHESLQHLHFISLFT